MLTRIFASFGGYISGLLFVTSLTLGGGWYLTNNKLERCQEARKVDKLSYEKAQAEAEVLWTKAVKSKEKEYEAKAKQADKDYSNLNAKYRDAARVYIETQGRTRQSSGTPEGGNTEGDYRSSTDTELPVVEVIIKSNDLLICAENTARLVIAREWALGLND